MARARTHAHTHVHPHTQARMSKQTKPVHTHAHTHTHTHALAPAHARTHTHTHTYARARTRMHARARIIYLALRKQMVEATLIDRRRITAERISLRDEYSPTGASRGTPASGQRGKETVDSRLVRFADRLPSSKDETRRTTNDDVRHFPRRISRRSVQRENR